MVVNIGAMGAGCKEPVEGAFGRTTRKHEAVDFQGMVFLEGFDAVEQLVVGKGV